MCAAAHTTVKVCAKVDTVFVPAYEALVSYVILFLFALLTHL
jgi:hypothetical protein